MKIHHLNCGTLCPYFSTGGLSLRQSGTLTTVCHCLLIETPKAGLVLVDTGLGLDEVNSDGAHVPRLWRTLIRPQLKVEETALKQVERLGFTRRDVRHIVVTHLDFDHAGGVPDFPEATVHVHRDEFEGAFREPARPLRPRTIERQFRHQPDWRIHDVNGESWEGFEAVRPLPGTEDSILMVPLIGHSRGHCGVAIETGDRMLLHAGDAYMTRADLDGLDVTPTSRIMQAFQKLADDNTKLRQENQLRLKKLVEVAGHRIQVFCSHDVSEYILASQSSIEKSDELLHGQMRKISV